MLQIVITCVFALCQSAISDEQQAPTASLIEPLSTASSDDNPQKTPLVVKVLHGAEDREFLEHLKPLESEGVVRITGEAHDSDLPSAPLSVTIDGPPLTDSQQFQELLRKLHGLQIAELTVFVTPQPRTNQRQVSVAQVSVQSEVRADAVGRVVDVLERESRFSVLMKTAEGSSFAIPKSRGSDVEDFVPGPERKPTAVHVFVLQNTRAADVARIIEQLFVRTGLESIAVGVAVDERTNSLIVRGDADTLAEIQTLLQRLDSASGDANESSQTEGNEPTLQAMDRRFDSTKGTGFRSDENSFTFYFGIASDGESADQLRQQYHDLEQSTQELAEKLRGPLPDPRSGDRMKKELRDTVQRTFLARQKFQRAELAEFARRLKDIHQSIEMRDKISEQIVDRRVEELLDPNLKWEPVSADITKGATADIKPSREARTLDEVTAAWNNDTRTVRRELFGSAIPDLTVDQLRNAMLGAADAYRRDGKVETATALKESVASGRLVEDLTFTGSIGTNTNGFRQISPSFVFGKAGTDLQVVILPNAELRYSRDGYSSKSWGDIHPPITGTWELSSIEEQGRLLDPDRFADWKTKHAGWTKLDIGEHSLSLAGDTAESFDYVVDYSANALGELRLSQSGTVEYRGLAMSNAFVDDTKLSIVIDLEGRLVPKTFNTREGQFINLNYVRAATVVGVTSESQIQHGIEDLLTRLSQEEQKIKSLAVTTDYVKREAYLIPFDSAVELKFTTKAIVDILGRSRVDAEGQQLNIEPDGKSIRTYNGRWVGVFNDGVARNLTYYEGNLSSASIDSALSWHGIDPREFTTHFQREPVTEILRARGAEIGERTEWDGRPVTIVETIPAHNESDARRYRFWIDRDRGIVVRRAITIRYKEGQPWQEYSRIESRDHREIAPGIWLPMHVKYESLEVTPDVAPEKVSWRYEGTNRDWQVNVPLSDDAFDLEFPGGIQVNDHRPPAQPESNEASQ